MAKDNLILTKSYPFALEIISLYQHMTKEKKDFIAKFQISYKEARETHYWLKLLRDSKILSEQETS